MELEFEVPGKPQGKARPRAARMGSRVRMYTPEQTVTYENKILACYLAACHREGCAGLRFAPPVALEVEAYFTVPKSYPKAKAAACLAGTCAPTAKPDADNIAKAVADALNGVAYKDDSCIARLAVEKKYGDTERLTVRISGEVHDENSL